MKKSIIVISSIVAISSAFASVASAVPVVSNLSQIRPVETTPVLARECEEGKTVYVTVKINQNGDVTQASAIRAHAYDAALALRVERSVNQWKFVPAKDSQGHVKEITVVLPVYISSVKPA